MLSAGSSAVVFVYAVKTSALRTIARDTAEGWADTLAFFASQHIAIETKRFSDYSGDTIPSDQLYYYHNAPAECPVLAPSWIF